MPAPFDSINPLTSNPLLKKGFPEREKVDGATAAFMDSLPMNFNLKDVKDSQGVFDKYWAIVPKVRKAHPEAEGFSDEDLVANMMTNDRFANKGDKHLSFAPDDGFLTLDKTGGHRPDLAAAEHRAFVLSTVANEENPVKAGVLAVALGAATPAYAAAKAAGFKKGSKPSLAQLLGGLQGAGEAFANIKLKPI